LKFNKGYKLSDLFLGNTVERADTMKKHLWLPALIILALSGLSLNACSYSIQILSTPASVVPTETTINVAPAVAQMEATPTLVLPTPTFIAIRPDTVSLLENFETFQMGDLVRSVAFTPDGTVLAAAGGNSGDYAIHLWDVASGQSIGMLDQHTGIVWGVAFSPDGQLLASVSSDATAKIWDWRNGNLIKSLDFPGAVVSVGFSPNGQALAVGGVDTSQNQIQNAAVWTYAVGSWTPQLKLPEYLNVTAMAYSPQGGTIIGGGTSRNVQVWRTDTSSRVFTLSHAHQVTKAAISPDGSTLATGTCATAINDDCTEGAVWLWDLPTGKLLNQQLGGFPAMVESLAFSADGSALIVGSRDGTLRVYATSDYRSVFEVASSGGINTLALSPDGGLLAIGSDNGDVHVWKNVYRP
jgi:WD40 repeat protein